MGSPARGLPSSFSPAGVGATTSWAGIETGRQVIEFSELGGSDAVSPQHRSTRMITRLSMKKMCFKVATVVALVAALGAGKKW